MSGLLFIPGIEQADLADEATVQAALASALWFPGSPASICGIEEPGLLFALSASTALNPYPLALFGADPTPDGALWRGTLASSVFSDTGGTTPATLGGTVARVNDTSGNGINLSQASSSLRPKFGSRPIVGIRNLCPVSEPVYAEVVQKSNITDAAGFGDFVASILFAANGVASYAYSAGVLPSGVAGTMSAFVKMADGNPPIFTSASATNVGNTFVLRANSANLPALDHVVEALGDGIYRVSVPITGTGTGNCGIIQYASNEQRAFLVTGFQLEVGDLSDYQHAVSAQDVSEAGVESVTYLLFDLVDDALPSAAFASGLTGQAFVAGDGGCYVTDLTLAPAATFSIGGTSHNWTGATPGILRAVTGNTGRVLDVAVREGDFTETELDRLVRKYRALGGKGLLVPTGELLTLASMTGGTGWAYASSIWTKTAGVASLLSQAVVPIAAGYYQFEIAATRSAGTLTPRFTGTTTVSGAAISATGTHTGVLVAASGNNAFELSADSAFDGTVTAVSLQRLLPDEEL